MKKALVIFLVLFSMCACGNGGKVNKVSRGVLDLSGGIPDNVIRLNGQWLIYWEHLVSPEKRDELHTGFKPGTIKVPGAWNSYVHDNRPVNPNSFGTYRMGIILPPGKHNVALKFPEITNPNRIWVNGTAVTAAQPGEFEREQTRRRKYQPFIYRLQGEGKIDILIQMANTNHLRGGLRAPILFGRDDAVFQRHRVMLIMQVLLAGIQIIIALYHAALFFLRRRVYSNLFFAFLCFFMFIRTGVTGENFIPLLVPELPWVVQAKLEALSYYLSVGMVYFFIHHLFRNHSNRAVSVGVALITAAASIAVIVLSPFIYPYTLIPFQIFTIVVGLYCFYIFYRAFSDKPAEVLLILVAWIIMFVFTLNDILYVDNILGSSGYLVPVGIAMFTIIQSFVISLRFSRAFDRVEHLSAELEEQNRLLEERVLERTLSLQDKNRDLEYARDIAAKDMAMAVYVQQSILPEGPPRSKEWDAAFSFIPMSGVSGDFYDFYEIDGTLRGAGIFDVSGHGISSGLVSMIAKWVLFRHFLKHLDAPLGRVFGDANRELVNEIGNSSYYLTGVLLRFDGSKIVYSNAGHRDTYIKRGTKVFPIRKDDGEVARGPLVGLIKDEFHYDDIHVEVNKGDFIVALTDGLIESADANGTEYGTERIVRSISSAECFSARDLLDRIMSDFTDFTGGDPFPDDVTVVVFMKR